MIVRATATLFTSRGMKSLAQFARNILVARLLSVEDFGIAATFAIVFTLIEMATDVGLNRMAVQDRDGDRADFMATLHGVQLARGVAGAALTLLLAWPYAAILNLPELFWAYQLMALVPLIRGLLHYDIFRAQREMRFWPMGLTQGLSPLLSLAIIAATYAVTPDYRIMLWAVIGQQAIEVALSHLLARRPYRLGWQWPVARRALRFGAPLMANGLLLFAMMNGDRLVVANQLGPVALGLFSAALLLTLIPAAMLTSTLSGVALPGLSRAQADAARFRPLALTVMEANLLLAGGFALGTALVGPALLVLAFGERYAAAGTLVVLLGAAQAARMCKSGPATIAMARGMTANPLLANLPRLLSLPVAFAVLAQGGGLVAVALVALAGEAAGAAVAIWLLRGAAGIAPARLALPLVATALVVGGGVALALARPVPVDPLAHPHWAPLGLVALFVLLAASLRNLHRALRPRPRASPVAGSEP